MNWKTFAFIGMVATIVFGSFYLSFTGASLPAPDEEESFSLRNVENRRSHYMRYYSFGK